MSFTSIKFCKKYNDSKEYLMNILEIISKKRDKKELTKEEIEFFIHGYTQNEITDYQAAALIMAIYLNGMTMEETTHLTLAMANSGEVLDLSEFGTVVDKHSTGGVGDKITLILMPIMAALGVTVAKMSGRGLGFTGGTADKIEAIPGYQTNLTIKEFKKNIQEIGISLITQTGNLAPADKKLYALRDAICCVDSIPLIASSIMSKKIAAGANKIVLDVTCGNGAFMKTKEKAIELSKVMKEIGRLAEKETICIITNMEEPLGYYIGNSLEVIEVLEALKGNMPKDIKEVVLTLGSYMMKLAGKGENIEENKKKIEACIISNLAYEKFLELLEKQGGDTSYCKDIKKFQIGEKFAYVIKKEKGYIKEIKAEEIGKASCLLGAGRIKKEDIIDLSAGIILHKKVGDYIEKGEIIATLYTKDISKIEQTRKIVEEAITIIDTPVERKKMILKII